MSTKTISLNKLKQLQGVCAILLDEFIRVCNEHNLNWFLDAGSLLGAIRHKGFIPWDDDVDVVMPRKDYNILYENGDKWFKEPFCFYTCKNLKGDNLTIQLKYSNSTLIYQRHLCYLYRRNGVKFDLNRGISMDIEPIDHIPDERHDRIVLMHEIDYLYTSIMYLDPKVQDTEVKRISSLANIKRAATTYNELMTSIDRKFDNLIACTPWWQFENSRGKYVSSKCYDSFTEQTFEGCKEKVRIPVGYDDILKSYYGDYMKEIEDYSLYDNVIIDDKKSFRYYEQFTNEELIKIMKEENKNGD